MEKHKRITETLVTENLEKVMSKASPSLFSDGQQWYWEANEFVKNLAQKYDLQEWKTASLVAVLSPLKSWELNKRITEEFINGKTDVHFSKQVNKALEILRLDAWGQPRIEAILQGQKTVSFYHNLLNPSNPDFVTIDRHVLDSLVFEGANITPQRYVLIENVIKQYSKQLNLVPCSTQAIVWVTHKHLKKVA